MKSCKMKNFMKKWMFTACNLCIALGGFVHWKGFSLLFYGEPPYPTETEE